MKDLINQTISNITAYPDDELVHMLKCASSTASTANKKLFKPLIAVIEKERRKRGTSQTISSKPIQPKLSTNAINCDDEPEEQTSDEY